VLSGNEAAQRVMWGGSIGQKSTCVARLPRSGTGFPAPAQEVRRPRCETAHFRRTLVLGSPDRPTRVLFRIFWAMGRPHMAL